MSGFERLPEAAAEVFGEGASAVAAYDLLTVDVPAASWLDALTTARDELGCTFFDWLSAVDEPGTGFQVCAHVVALAEPSGDAEPAGARGVRRLLVRTTVPYDAAALPTATGVYAGATWHERETHEMFGVDFPGHPGLDPLLLPEEFEGHPLRKDFVLAARVAKAWPGAKEPGESHDGGPKRRQMLPPGVPDPNDWGPLKGQLPPAPARTPRAGAGAGPRAGAGAAGERPARRMRSAAAGSASQSAAQPPAAPAPEGAPAVPPRKRAADAPWEQPREPGAEPKPEPGPEPAAPEQKPEATAPEHKPEPEPEPAAPESESPSEDGDASAGGTT